MMRGTKLGCSDQRISRAGPANLGQVIAAFTEFVAENLRFSSKEYLTVLEHLKFSATN
jgi:hypothetical protein